MYSRVMTAIICGIDSVSVCVEADVSDGLPIVEMVGFLSAEVKEAKERVRTALRNSGFRLPAKRITINLSPAGLRKTGAGFDLPIAIAILNALQAVKTESLKDVLILGEISLQGEVMPIHGVLPIVAKAKEDGVRCCIIPIENYAEAKRIDGITVWGVSHIRETVELLNGVSHFQIPQSSNFNIEETEEKTDFSEISGQESVKRACEVAVAGMHNLLMIGPPGSGKSMIARRIAGILPPMTKEEQLEVSKIYSVCGMLKEEGGLITKRPFRSPHHTISASGLSGGGIIPKAGEVSLSHRGVLFLDELPEFKKTTLEILRQPMEEKKICLVRQLGNYVYPANFMLVAAMNPCKCGYYPDRNHCSCSKESIERYLGRISQPLLDRIDICVETFPIEYEELVGKTARESSEDIRARVIDAMKRQQKRFEGTNIDYNSEIPAKQIEKYCKIDSEQQTYMKEIYQSFELSARGYHKILKTARTIADLDDSEEIKQQHLNEAVCYRALDKKYWK